MEEKITAAQKFKLKHFVKQLEQFQGRHTELVTVYIPQGYDMNKIISHLSQEQGTASNIKSKQTRDNVIAALEKMVRHLKLFTRTPPHGLAAFAGNVAEREGQQDFQVWSIEPPIPLRQRLYRCDKEFILDPLQEMCEEKAVYGLVVMDKREGNVALLKGKTIIPVSAATSAVPGKTRAGGQCLDPDTEIILADGTRTALMNIQIGDELKSYDFGRGVIVDSECVDVEEVQKKEILVITTSHERIQASADHTFFVNQQGDCMEKKAADLKAGDTLYRFEPASNFEDLKDAKIESIEKKSGNYALIDISVENKNFIANNLIVHNSAPRFERLREGAAKEFMKKIADMMKDAYLENKDLKGIIIGGPGHTKNEFVDANYITDQLKRKILALKDLSYTGEFGLQELLDKSQDVLGEEEVMEEKNAMNKFFNLLATRPGMAAYGRNEVMEKLKMGVVDMLLLSEVLPDEEVEEFEMEAQKTGSKMMVISTETREGAQLKDLGKVAAILRYEMHE